MLQEGVASLEKSAETGMKNDFSPICEACKSGILSFKYDINDLIIFEFHDITMILEEIPKNIKIT